MTQIRPNDTKQLRTWLPAGHLRVLCFLATVLLLLVLIAESPRPLHDAPTSLPEVELEALQASDSSGQIADVAPLPSIVLTVARGNTLSSLFQQAGYGPALIDELMKAGASPQVLGDLTPGDEIEIGYLEDRAVARLVIRKSPLESHVFSRGETGGFVYQEVRREPEIRVVRKQATISDSLFAAAKRGGIPVGLALELANSIFGGVIDFIQDVRGGDTFTVLYEEHYLDGRQIDYGRLLAAEFINQSKPYVAVRFTRTGGESGYFTPEGESLRKAFILNPVDWTRISDGFSLSRKHPILNTIRAHKGTDYAAPVGTPVKATADGRVTFADRNGSFGKLIIIQHGNRYVTKYAHLNDYAKGIKAGVRVRQNDIIGYVGATGAANGPHLHYELLVDGMHQDSRKVFADLPQAEAIAQDEITTFRAQVAPWLLALGSAGGSGQKSAIE